ncbi:MAG TPA: hypothetical protein VHZ07_26145 [Bryobacteraceae bacterium]|nr:hypothetical protein [Bryobacteraceae bacterium]
MPALAGAAVFGVVLSFVPLLSHHNARTLLPAVQLQLYAERGNEAANAPALRPLHVRLSATDLPQRLLSVEVVNSVGSPVWNGSTRVAHDEATLDLPAMPAGAYFLRLYSGPRGQLELLREYSFQIN